MVNIVPGNTRVVDMTQVSIIETVIDTIINDLGATGLLVVGLYYFLGKPLKSISDSLKTGNKEMIELITAIKNNVSIIRKNNT